MPEHEETEATEAAEQEMERGADDMQKGVERLGTHIEEAEQAASERPEVSDEPDDSDES